MKKKQSQSKFLLDKILEFILNEIEFFHEKALHL